MEAALRKAIERQSSKLLARYGKKLADSKEHARRFGKRTGTIAKPANVRRPGVWDVSPHFNPAYCIKHSKYLARVIWQKILDRTYEVSPAVLFQIPKDSGGYRDVMVFSIVDAAVANLFNQKMRDRNKNRQSPFCYAYRKDRGLFDAVIQLASLLGNDKIYVIQYDFSKYFDTIRHDYIDFVIEKEAFSISPAERFIIGKFLRHKYAIMREYSDGVFQTRTAGVPQGSSLSLFLSNIAGHELDIELSKLNGSFVRFADDIVSVTHEFSDAIKVTQAFREHCYYSGISINRKKSPGIKLFLPTLPDDELRRSGRERDYFIDHEDIGRIFTLNNFDYIGHKFRSDSIGMSDSAVIRVKKRIAKILHIHLLHNPRRGMFSNKRIGSEFYDWDLVTCLNEIRKYLYGGLSEATLQEFILNNKRISRFRGLMGFYALVSDIEQFRELDGWLLSVVRRALRARCRILKDDFGVTVTPLSEQLLLSGSWYTHSGIIAETKLPSLVLAWRAARKAYQQYGLSEFQQPDYYSSVGFD